MTNCETEKFSLTQETMTYLPTSMKVSLSTPKADQMSHIMTDFCGAPLAGPESVLRSIEAVRRLHRQRMEQQEEIETTEPSAKYMANMHHRQDGAGALGSIFSVQKNFCKTRMNTKIPRSQRYVPRYPTNSSRYPNNSRYPKNYPRYGKINYQDRENGARCSEYSAREEALIELARQYKSRYWKQKRRQNARKQKRYHSVKPVVNDRTGQHLPFHTHDFDSELTITPRTCPLCQMGAPFTVGPLPWSPESKTQHSHAPTRLTGKDWPIIKEEHVRPLPPKAAHGCKSCCSDPYACTCTANITSDDTAGQSGRRTYEPNMHVLRDLLPAEMDTNKPETQLIDDQGKTLLTTSCCGWCNRGLKTLLPFGDINSCIVADYSGKYAYHLQCFSSGWMSDEEMAAPNMFEIMQEKIKSWRANLYWIQR